MRDELGAGLVQTELGPLFVASTETGVCFVELRPPRARETFERWRSKTLPGVLPGSSATHLEEACSQLQDFARGTRSDFDVPLDLFGSDFQSAVWAELTRIPCGATRTYAQIARAIGKPGASRAVGLANNRNPVPIFVPCHRVVASSGLGGFGGGLELKRRLLSLEGALLPFA